MLDHITSTVDLSNDEVLIGKETVPAVFARTTRKSSASRDAVRSGAALIVPQRNNVRSPFATEKREKNVSNSSSEITHVRKAGSKRALGFCPR